MQETFFTHSLEYSQSKYFSFHIVCFVLLIVSGYITIIVINKDGASSSRARITESR